MVDNFANMMTGLDSPCSHAASVSLSTGDATLGNESRGIYVGTAGDLKVTLSGGEQVTFFDLSGGVIHPIRASIVHQSTGTDPSNIISVW